MAFDKQILGSTFSLKRGIYWKREGQKIKRKSDFMIPINTLHDLVAEVQALQEQQEQLMAEIHQLKREKQAPVEPKVLPKLPKQPEQSAQETINPALAYFLLRK